MEKEYWVFEDEKLTGPWTQAQMLEAWRLGHLQRDTLCSIKGVEGWVKVGNLDFLSSTPPKNTTAAYFRTNLKLAGGLCIAAGAVGIFYCLLIFNSSVHTEAIGNVNNIGLMGDRICWIIASVGTVLFGGQLLTVEASKK